MSWEGYISYEEALEICQKHPKTLERHLRTGHIKGAKVLIRSRWRWLVSRASLIQYYQLIPTPSFAYTLSAQMPTLSQTAVNPNLDSYWVLVYDYSEPTETELYTVYYDRYRASTVREAANQARRVYGREALVVKIEKNNSLVVDDDNPITF